MSALHASARAPHLAVARIGVFALWGFIVARVDTARFANVEPDLVTPRGVLRLVPLEPLVTTPDALAALQVLALIGCALCVLGVRPFTPVALATATALLVVDGSMKALGGYANHAQEPALYVAFILAAFPAADAWSAFGRARSGPRSDDPWRYRAPLVLSTLALTMTYSLIGLRRLVGGGFELFTGPSVEAWLVARSLEWAEYGFDHGLLVLEHRWLVPAAAIAMVGTTVLEVLAPAVLRSPRFRLVWVPAVATFHLVTLLTMRIFFWENLVLIALLVTGLPYLVVRLVERRSGSGRQELAGSASSDPGAADRASQALD